MKKKKIFPVFTASKNYPGFIGGPYYYSIVNQYQFAQHSPLIE